MIRFGKYLCVESKDEILSSNVIDGAEINNVDALLFPCFFVRSEPYDLHFCDFWIPSECFEDMYVAIDNTINELKDYQKIIIHAQEARKKNDLDRDSM